MMAGQPSEEQQLFKLKTQVIQLQLENKNLLQKNQNDLIRMRQLQATCRQQLLEIQKERLHMQAARNEHQRAIQAWQLKYDEIARQLQQLRSKHELKASLSKQESKPRPPQSSEALLREQNHQLHRKLAELQNRLEQSEQFQERQTKQLRAEAQSEQYELLRQLQLYEKRLAMLSQEGCSLKHQLEEVEGMLEGSKKEVLETRRQLTLQKALVYSLQNILKAKQLQNRLKS